MKIVLTSEVEKLGSIGDVVIVKDGYARNFLIPSGKALFADKGTLKRVESQKAAIEKRSLRELKTHTAIAQRIAQVELVTKVSVGEEGRMFGAVTSSDIAELLLEKGIEIDRRMINLTEPIKALGIYHVPIKIHAEVTARVKLRVEPENASE